MQIRHILDDYALWHETMGHSPKTISWYRWILTTLAQWLEANGRSSRITEVTLADVRAFLHAEAHRGEHHQRHPSSHPKLARSPTERCMAMSAPFGPSFTG